jgi:hypothetical protein
MCILIKRKCIYCNAGWNTNFLINKLQYNLYVNKNYNIMLASKEIIAQYYIGYKYYYYV